MLVARECKLDVERVLQLDVVMFQKLLSIAIRLERQRDRDEWLRSTFVGWQVVSALGAKVSFRDYVKRLGMQELLDG